MSEAKTMSIRTVIAVCIALVAGSWALSGEIHNGQLRGITIELESAERKDTASLADRSQIWRAIDKLVIVSENHQETIRDLQGKTCD